MTATDNVSSLQFPGLDLDKVTFVDWDPRRDPEISGPAPGYGHGDSVLRLLEEHRERKETAGNGDAK